MKTINTLAIAVLITFLISACASSSKMAFGPSNVTPAATGDVNIKKDKNENFVIDVSVVNLADPQRLSPARETYVVWMENGNSPVRKSGRIETSSATFSKAMKAGLSATATTQPTRVFITAEKNGELQFPEGEVVLSTQPSSK